MTVIQILPFLENGKPVKSFYYEKRLIKWTEKSPYINETNVQDVLLIEDCGCTLPVNIQTENKVAENVFLFASLEMQFVEERNVLLIGCVRQNGKLLHLAIDNLVEVQEIGIIVCENEFISSVIGSKGSMLRKISDFLEVNVRAVNYDFIFSKIKDSEY